MAVAYVRGQGKFENFVSSTTETLDLTGVDFLTVLAGRLNNSTPVPTGCTVDGVSMTAETTWTDYLGRSWRLFHKVVSLSGSKNITASYDSSNGGAIIMCAGWSGVDSTTPISGLQNTSAGTGTSLSWTVSSATGDLVGAMVYENVGRTLTAGTGTTIDAYESGSLYRFNLYEAGASSVTIGGTWSANAEYFGTAFSLKAASGGGGSIVGPGLMSSPLLSGRLLRGLVR